jgi:hypothetical protein
MTALSQGFIINTEFVMKTTATRDNKESLRFSIDGCRQRKRRILNQMRKVSQQLRQSKVFDPRKLDEYQELNDQLKAVKVYETELVYLRNML